MGRRAAVVLLACIAACDGRPQPAPPAPDLLKAQREQMKKAQEVGDVLERAQAARRESEDAK